jgi:uncharacterized phiE125 gp8 family phage protein
MGFELITPPASEPVSLDEAKAHLRVDHDDEDALIARLVRTARETAERHTGRAFITQGWRLWRDCWPASRTLEIPRPPLIAVSAVTAYGRSGAEIAVSSDAYIVDSASVPGRLVLKETASLPVDLAEANAISVAFQAGYGANAADVPAAIRNAILSLVAHLYEARGNAPAEPPAQVSALLAPFRVSML